MPMVTIRMLGWSGAKVACQKSACDTMSLKCQGTWRTGGRRVSFGSGPEEAPPATEDPFHSRASPPSRRMPNRAPNSSGRAHAAPKKWYLQGTDAPLSVPCRPRCHPVIQNPAQHARLAACPRARTSAHGKGWLSPPREKSGARGSPQGPQTADSDKRYFKVF